MRLKKISAAMAAVMSVLLLSLNTAAPAAWADVSSVDLTGQMRYFADPGKNGPAEESFPLFLPEAGSIALNYWSNYFTTENPEKNVSHVRVTGADGRLVWSQDRIGKGDQVFNLALDAGQYEITVGSDTADGRITFEVFYTPGSAAGSFQGALRAAEIADDAGGGILSLSGDASLYLDADLTVERLEALGGEDRTLTVTGPGTLQIRSPALRAEKVLLNVAGGTVIAPELSGFIQTGGAIRILGGSADSFRIFGGELTVESDGDGLTGPFEIHGGDVRVNAAGCGILCSQYSGAPVITGGTALIRGARRAVLVERLREEGQGASDNLGYRLEREEIPLCLAGNVAVERPSGGWIRISATEYLFPENIREILLTSLDKASPVKD